MLQGLRSLDRGGLSRDREVSIGDVLREHAVRVEEGAVNADAMLLDVCPCSGISVERSDALLELFVETVGFGFLRLAVFNGPASGVLGTAFDPPAVQNREDRKSVV